MDPREASVPPYETLDIMDYAEVFDDQDDVFLHTAIILQCGSKYFLSFTKDRFNNASEIKLQALDVRPMPLSQIQPIFPLDLTEAPKSLTHNTYVKRPNLFCSPVSTKALVLHEARICEILKRSPHPCVAEYLGCLVEEGRISGLCFRRYGLNVLDKSREGINFDKSACLQNIREGIEHLHGLGIIHCDINPSNVFSNLAETGQETFVIGDFDSCAWEGQPLGLKAGTKGWAKEASGVATREMDWYGLAKIAEVLSFRINE